VPVGTVEYYSDCLETRTWYTFILPYVSEVGPPPYGVLLMLHGKYGNHDTWMRYSKLAQYAEYLPVMVVMPAGGNSYWADPVEKFVMQELMGHVRATYKTREDLAWAVGGYSMGGFGALRLGLKYPERFSSVYAHSSALRAALKLGLDCQGPAQAAVARGAGFPPITFDCGLEDGQLEANRELHRELAALGVPHAFHEHAGGHTWDYWDEHVKDALTQTMVAFGSEKRPPTSFVPMHG